MSDAGTRDRRRRRPKPGRARARAFAERRDWNEFADAYGDPSSGAARCRTPTGIAPVCRGPITYPARRRSQHDIANFKAALAAAGMDDGFLNSVAPGSCARFGNEYYENDEELIYACADAMREEYQAIIDAGLILQLDDPAIAENWDQIDPEPSRRGLPALHDGPRRGAQPRDPRAAARTESASTSAGAAGTART